MIELSFFRDIACTVFYSTIGKVSSLLLADNEPPEVAAQFRGQRRRFLGLEKFG